MYRDVSMLYFQGVSRIDDCSAWRRVDVLEVTQKLGLRDRKNMLVQPGEIVYKAKPGRGWYHTAGPKAAGRVEVDGMHGRSIVSLILKEVKILAGVHRQVDVELAHSRRSQSIVSAARNVST